MNRRRFLLNATATAAGLGLMGVLGRSLADARPQATVPAWQLTAEQWRKQLTAKQYRILREAGTEPSGSSPLNDEHRKGIYHCAGCELPVYSSASKFHSGTGWPSFYQPLPDSVATRTDTSFLMTRTEVHCRRCAGHLGHLFNDGPQPTGLRYCMNGTALHFVAATHA